jgi:hypothetical protein
VVQRATREHLMAERRRRAAKLATRGVPPGATDSLPPPRDLPDRRLPTSATKADAAARRRSKGASWIGDIEFLLAPQSVWPMSMNVADSNH